MKFILRFFHEFSWWLLNTLISLCNSFVGYEGKDKPNLNFFSPAQRSRMVHEIMLRTRYGDEHQQFGMSHAMSHALLVYILVIMVLCQNNYREIFYNNFYKCFVHFVLRLLVHVQFEVRPQLWHKILQRLGVLRSTIRLVIAEMAL